MRLRGWGRDALIVWKPEADNGGGTDQTAQETGETPETPTPTVEELQKQLAETQDKLKRANAESAERRKKLQEHEAAEQKRKAASMTEQEQAEANKKAAEESARLLRETRRDLALATVATKHPGLDVELLGKLITVEFDDAGMPVNVEAAVNDALAKWPHLKPVSGSGANPTNPGRKPQLTMEDVKKMSPDEINRRWDEVQGVLAAGR